MTRAPLLTRVMLAAALWPLMDAALRACPICFQIENTRAVGGVRVGVAVLVAVTASVVGGCAVFFGRLVRREAAPNACGQAPEQAGMRQ
jgi:ABC-type enterochelin transport system permease subunit